MQTPQNWGGGGLSKYALLNVGTCQNTAYSSTNGSTNDNTVFSLTLQQTNTATVTFLKAGKYHYDAAYAQRGTNTSFSVVIGGVTRYSLSNNVVSGDKSGDVTVNANDTCVVTVGSGVYFADLAVVLTTT